MIPETSGYIIRRSGNLLPKTPKEKQKNGIKVDSEANSDSCPECFFSTTENNVLRCHQKDIVHRNNVKAGIIIEKQYQKACGKFRKYDSDCTNCGESTWNTLNCGSVVNMCKLYKKKKEIRPFYYKKDIPVCCMHWKK